MQKRDNAFELAKETSENNDWKKARKLRNKVNHLCSLAKDEYTKKNINDNAANPIKFWKKINNEWGDKKQQNKSDIILINPDTKCNIEPNQTANLFNEYFCSIASKIQNNTLPLSNEEGQSLYQRDLNCSNNSENHSFNDSCSKFSEAS